MTHEDCLNALLADSCSNPSDIEGFQEYSIELHCSSWVVIAKPLGNFKYEIHSMQKDHITHLVTE